MRDGRRDLRKAFLYDYTKLLLGRIQNFPTSHFANGAKNNHVVAMRVIRFAIEVFLQWSPYDAKERLDSNIINLMKLDTVYKYVIFPPELDKERDYWYLAHLLYPQFVPYDMKKLTVRVYQDVCERVRPKFPKGYFDDADGRRRACMCLGYYIENKQVFHNTEEMYRFFASPEGRRCLDDNQFKNVWRSVFGSPVVFLHETLPLEQRDEFLFHFYQFQYLFEETEATMKKMEQAMNNPKPRRKRRKKAEIEAERKALAEAIARGEIEPPKKRKKRRKVAVISEEPSGTVQPTAI